MNSTRRAGFTLIELLTVIAIIAILASMIFAVGPRLIERAKEQRLANALKQVNTALVAYFTDYKSSYPPAYGFIGVKPPAPAPPADTTLDETYYCLKPYMYLMKYHGNEGMYDEFSTSYDTNGDRRLSLLEFQPIGTLLPTKVYEFAKGDPRYDESNNPTEVGRQLAAKKRPFIYIPVNKSQANLAIKYWINHVGVDGGQYGNCWNPADADFPKNIQFPPTKYDAFVLISVGPGGSTFGLVDDPPFFATNPPPPQAAYHIACLRSYFLATRDLNANGLLDFDFQARTQQKEGAVAPYPVGKNGVMCDNDLPPTTEFQKKEGPWIYVPNQ